MVIFATNRVDPNPKPNLLLLCCLIRKLVAEAQLLPNRGAQTERATKYKHIHNFQVFKISSIKKGGEYIRNVWWRDSMC